MAAVLDAVSLICFGGWLSQTDWLFGHHYGPPGPLLAAMLTGVGGVLATVAWVDIGRRHRLSASQQATATPPTRPWLQWLLSAALIVLSFPTGLIVWVGISALPKTQWQAQLKELDSATATVPQLIKALKSNDYHQRWRAAEAVARSVRNSSDAMPTDMPVATESPARTVDILADRKHLPELVAALADSLTGKDIIGSNAAVALGALGRDAESAVPALVASVRRGSGTPESEHDSDVLRWAATQALARIRPAGIAALIELSADKNPAVRRQVVGELGIIGPEAKSAIPALERSLNDDDEAVRQRAGIALPRIDPHWKPPADAK